MVSWATYIFFVCAFSWFRNKTGFAWPSWPAGLFGRSVSFFQTRWRNLPMLTNFRWRFQRTWSFYFILFYFFLILSVLWGFYFVVIFPSLSLIWFVIISLPASFYPVLLLVFFLFVNMHHALSFYHIHALHPYFMHLDSAKFAFVDLINSYVIMCATSCSWDDSHIIF